MRSPTAAAARAFVPTVLTLAVAALAGGGCQDKKSVVPPAMQRLTLLLPEADGPLVIHVRSDSFADGGEIPREHTAYGENVTPALSWSGIPARARSLVLLVEDPEAGDPKPFVHWMIYNIPARDDRIRGDLPNAPELNDPQAARQGTNSAGTIGYVGPKPPADAPARKYHFQVFALDRMLDLRPGATRRELIDAMTGHVVGKGQLVGTFRER